MKNNLLTNVMGSLFLLSGCSGGGSSSPSPAPIASEPVQKIAEFRLSGRVFDGPVVGADIRVFDANGILIAQGTSDQSASYSIELPENTPLPISITASGGTDLVTNRAADFEMTTLVARSGDQTANLSPISTLVAKAAKCANNETEGHLNALWSSVEENLDIGLDPTQSYHPLRSTIDPSNAATATLSNEASAEWIRRVDAQYPEKTMDETINAMACNFADTTAIPQPYDISKTSDPRLLAVTKTVEIGIRLEVLAGRLQVDGFTATSAMNAAITSILPEAASIDVRDVPVSDRSITGLLKAIALVENIHPDSTLTHVMGSLEGTEPDSVREVADRTFDVQVKNTIENIAKDIAQGNSLSDEEINQSANLPENKRQPTIRLETVSAHLEANSNAQLNWDSTDAQQCYASSTDGGFNGPQPLQGSFRSDTLSGDTQFTLRCSGAGGESQSSITVTVQAAINPIDVISIGDQIRDEAAPVDYDIVYVRKPRAGDHAHIKWAGVNPAKLAVNSDLMLLHPDGSEEVLIDTEHGAITDPFISFDGQWVYYSHFYDLREENLNYQRGNLPKRGSDIYRLHLTTRQIEQLTFQEFTPNTGTGQWDESNPVDPATGANRMGYGILNTAPAPIAGNKLVFTSNRNGFRPTKGFSYPTMQLFVMDLDTKNVTPIAPMTNSSALHPTPLADGRIMFSSYESQGLRDHRLWGVWSIWPDGRYWEPVASAFDQPKVFHFTTQLSDRSVVVENYYNLNNFGFGSLYRIPQHTDSNQPAFHSPDITKNPEIKHNDQGTMRMPFTPKGLSSITPLSTSNDNAAIDGYGKYTHPSAAPNNDLLVAWSDGPVNKLNRPTPWPAVDSGIYIMAGGEPVDDMSKLILIKNDPNFNEAWPRAVVPYESIHGIPEPKELPWLPNDGREHPMLPEGTPYGLIGASTLYKRGSAPNSIGENWDGLDAFNSSENHQSTNWISQGADAGLYDNSDIWALRILLMEPNPDRGYGPNSNPEGGVWFHNHANERLRILGEIPLRKYNSDGSAVMDLEGNPDTSFLAKIPADAPFTFQTIDKNGAVLNASQTWHQVRPGELRTCGGCHSHSQQSLDFQTTAAASPDYAVWDLTQKTPLVSQDTNGHPIIKETDVTAVDVEFFKDIRPVLESKCVGCHTTTNDTPPADLVLDDLNNYDGLPGDYARLCNDPKATWGIPPLVGSWRQTNASRYVRKFQSRRSLLMWKLWGQRTDGWDNSSHPSAAVLGDANTLPPGARINDADLDLVGSIMPIPGEGYAPLTTEEKMTFARWIDLGCAIDQSRGETKQGYGWFADDLRPVLTVSAPREGQNQKPVEKLIIGFADAYSGIDINSLSVTADFEIDGYPAGENLNYLFSSANDGVYVYPLLEPLAEGFTGTLSISIKDHQGNINRVTRTFSVAHDQ